MDVSDRERDLLHQVSELQARWDPFLRNLQFMNLISWLQLKVHELVRVCYLQFLVVNDVILLPLERSSALGFMGFWSISRTAYKKLIWLFLEVMYWPVWHQILYGRVTTLLDELQNAKLKSVGVQFSKFLTLIVLFWDWLFFHTGSMEILYLLLQKFDML